MLLPVLLLVDDDDGDVVLLVSPDNGALPGVVPCMVPGATAGGLVWPGLTCVLSLLVCAYASPITLTMAAAAIAAVKDFDGVMKNSWFDAWNKAIVEVRSRPNDRLVSL